MTFPEKPLDGSREDSSVDLPPPTEPGGYGPADTVRSPISFDELDALATGTWLSVPPGSTAASQSLAEATRSAHGQGLGRKVLKNGAIGLAVGFVTASGAYALSALMEGRGSDRSTEQVAVVTAPKPRGPATRAELTPPPAPPGLADQAAEQGEGRPAEAQGDPSPLALLHAMATAPRGSRGASLGVTGGRTSPGRWTTPSRASDGIPTARYPDILLSDDPQVLSLIAEEVTQLKRARLAVEKGDPSAAMAELESYRTKTSHHVLETEAMAIGAEALILQNKPAEAAQLAQMVLARHPEAELADRMGAIANGPIK